VANLRVVAQESATFLPRGFEMTSLLKIAILLLALYTSPVPVDSAETVFESLKSLQGQWSILSEGKPLPIQMSYEIGSKGSIVTEQFGKELSAFYGNKRNIEMIHFCNAGNQPRLRLIEGGQPGFFVFKTFDITNLNGDTAHVEKMVYTLVSDKRVNLEIMWQGDKVQRSERYNLTKI
jgi:hypothetical protein